MEVGKYHVLVCTQNKPPMVPSCGGAGAMDVMDTIRQKVFEAGLEKEVFVTGTGCVGICHRGPNVIIYPEGKWYTAVNAENVIEIIQSHIQNGTVVENRNDPDAGVINEEVGQFQERIKMMMADAGKL